MYSLPAVMHTQEASILGSQKDNGETLSSSGRHCFIFYCNCRISNVDHVLIRMHLLQVVLTQEVFLRVRQKYNGYILSSSCEIVLLLNVIGVFLIVDHILIIMHSPQVVILTQEVSLRGRQKGKGDILTV